MKFRMGKAGPIVLIGIAIYVGTMQAQTRAAASLCESYPVGSPIGELETIEPWLLNRMGPIPDADNAGAQFAIYCANMTMCDVSCRLTVKDGVVIEESFSAH